MSWPVSALGPCPLTEERKIRLWLAHTFPTRPADGRGPDWHQGVLDAKVWLAMGLLPAGRLPCETAIGCLDYIDGAWAWLDVVDA